MSNSAMLLYEDCMNVDMIPWLEILQRSRADPALVAVHVPISPRLYLSARSIPIIWPLSYG
jgi:hypothetical protein